MKRIVKGANNLMWKMQEFECPVCGDHVTRLVQTQDEIFERHDDEATGCTAVLVPCVSAVKGWMK